jgi:hypothetical protein
MNRSLDELRVRASGVFQLGGELRKKLIAFAVNQSPTGAYQLAQATLINHGFVAKEAEAYAKSVRWLAVIRRDYGQTEFDSTVMVGVAPTE